MTIPNEQAAQYNSLQNFIGFFKEKNNAPSFANLFSVHLSTPPMMGSGGYQRGTKYDPQQGDLRELLNYYADSVNLPSKQVTTGNYNQLGSAIRYATGSTFSQISINFRVPRSGETRAFFERWIALMSNDASQYTEYYENYACPFLRIYKWERGGGDLAVSKREMLRAIRDSRLTRATALTPKLDQLTGVYELRNVFPFNIGSIQLDNSQNKLMTMSVQFYYERYRFFQSSEFSQRNERIFVPAPVDNATNPGTDPLGRISVPSAVSQFGSLSGRVNNSIDVGLA
ncbi:hypothetical protein Syn7803C76_6 [Synechococcus phage ACG-2014b]|uniref:Uncharacterized protein n=2 Tax=Synechococcus phage ACG-2014b TaxID=1493508 RepID=A0A0E3ET45_9CAUD|nr:hypothetical protein ABF04_gp006 [Synechococcus phage ACG-2014b]YP_009779635.1 hypothetical protein HOQ67_gp007 [Synechococcus phage ACG-2014b]YP_009779849.1 hypothetical protein HOQ68_gp006 [Synechococcus phage ACG-2014b]AIX17229.1 hypothetical protein Syn7803C61_7 [Synechococcus phage ACG-2014b]AIX17443.1 hypothetical protein Syn7803C66_6 [Synechococcus phage ACG-2014b]AIX17658.1 hypothetical protein Syn7803C67_6 [Synechococcus phage ACG-2014b]AIX17875.1 hypothetical protein Syn7803C68_7